MNIRSPRNELHALNIIIHDDENACLPNTISAHFDIDPVRFAGDNMTEGIRMLPDAPAPSDDSVQNDVDETA